MVIFDIIIKFNTAIIEKGKMIKERVKIIKVYIQTNFIFDLISITGLILCHYSKEDKLKWAGLVIYYKYF